jgi:hypothetical protein
MKRIINFLLFTAQEKIQVVIVFVLIGIPLYSIAILMSLGLSVEAWHFIWLPLIVWLLAGSNFYCISRYVTSFQLRNNRLIIVYDHTYRPEFYTQPIWGKTDHVILKFPKGMKLPVQDKDYDVEVLLEIEPLHNGKSSGRKFFLPFTINFQFFEDIDAWDVHHLITLQDSVESDQCVFEFEECVQYIFNEYNASDKRSNELEKLLFNLLNQTGDRKLIQGLLAKQVSFPQDVLAAHISITKDDRPLKISMLGEERVIY